MANLAQGAGGGLPNAPKHPDMQTFEEVHDTLSIGASLATAPGQKVDDEETLDALEAPNVPIDQKPIPTDRALAAAWTWATVEENKRVRQVLQSCEQDELMDRVEARCQDVTEKHDA